MFLFYSFMRLWTKCVNKCLHENEFLQASYVHILSCRCRYMCRYMCRCGCVDVHMQIVFTYASVYRTRVFIAREYLSHASTYLEFPQQAFTCGFYDRPSLKITTKHTDFKNPVKIAVYG